MSHRCCGVIEMIQTQFRRKSIPILLICNGLYSGLKRNSVCVSTNHSLFFLSAERQSRWSGGYVSLPPNLGGRAGEGGFRPLPRPLPNSGEGRLKPTGTDPR